MCLSQPISAATVTDLPAPAMPARCGAEKFVSWDGALDGRGVVGPSPATTWPRDLLYCSPLMVETIARSRG